MAVNAAAFLVGYAYDSRHPAWSITYLAQPATYPPGVLWGWLNWNDQAAYMASARAWWAGDFDPALHAYPAGYMLLGAAFVGLLGNNAFLAPNLGCLLVSQLLFARLFRRLSPGLPAAAAWGGLIFLITTGASRWMLLAWVEPWTTTLSTPLTYAALLGAVAFLDRGSARMAFAAAVAGGAIVAVRPADAAPVLLAVAAALIWATLRRWPGASGAARWAGAALGGLGLALAAAAMLHVQIYGWALSGYSRTSAEVGFEWRLIPLRWVDLVIDARPMGTEPGLMVRFWWFAPGVAGLLAAGAAASGRRIAHCVIAVAVVAHLLLFLSYRDLHASGLWRFGNYHYFKWIIPVLGGYAFLWARSLLAGQRLVAVTAMAVVLPLFLLRVAPGVLPTQAPVVVSPSEASLPGGVPGLGDAVILATDSAHIPSIQDVVTVGEQRLRPNIDFKLYPFRRGVVLATVRVPPPGPAKLLFHEPVLDLATTGVAVRQSIVFGLPCWLGASAAACSADTLLPAGVLEAGRTLSFAGDAPERFLLTGWSGADPAGRWTVGAEAGLRFRVTGELGQDLPLVMRAGPFAWSDKYPLEVTLVAGVGDSSRPVAHWRIQTSQPALYQASIPTAAIAADGDVELHLLIGNPRSPWQMNWSRDARALGLQVVSLQIGDASSP